MRHLSKNVLRSHWSSFRDEAKPAYEGEEPFWNWHAHKKTNFATLAKYTYPFIAETLFLYTENINNILNTQSRSYELKLFQQGETYKQLRMSANKDHPNYSLLYAFENGCVSSWN